MLYSSKSKYRCSNDGTLMWWRHHVNKPLHNPHYLYSVRNHLLVLKDIVIFPCVLVVFGCLKKKIHAELGISREGEHGPKRTISDV